jgi:MFS family permease
LLPPALRYRDLRLFYAGAVASQIGSQFTTVAMAWQMYELTNSALDVGLLGLGRALPQIALAAFGGMLADALDRRRLMMAVQLANFCVSASLTVLTMMHVLAPQTLIVAAMLFAVGTAAETPSRQAVVPNLVPRQLLGDAIALINTQRNVAIIVGPSLAGVALAVASPALCYGIDAASWGAMLLALAFIRRPMQGEVRGKLSVDALLAGARFVFSQQVILSFMVLDFGATFFGTSKGLMPIFARDILGVGPAGLGLLYAAPSVGAVCMAFAMSTRIRIDRAGRWVLVGVSIYGACMLGFAMSHVMWLSLLMLVGTGAGNTMSAVLRGISNQTLTPDHLRGRVTAFNSMFTQGGPQLGQFEGGIVAQLAGAQVSAATGALGACALAATIALLPRVRRFSFSEHASPAVAIA